MDTSQPWGDYNLARTWILDLQIGRVILHPKRRVTILIMKNNY